MRAIMPGKPRDRLPQGAGRAAALLTGVALAAASCVVGFMLVAMRNARSATQQRLTAVYAGHLEALARQTRRSGSSQDAQECSCGCAVAGGATQ
jgi:hypothetical protein